LTRRLVRKRLFVGLLAASLLLLCALGVILLYLVSHRENAFNQILLIILAGFLLLAGLIVAFGISGLVLTLWSAKSIRSLQGPTRIATNLMFPFVMTIGQSLGISADVIRRSFVEVNNQLVKTRAQQLIGSEVLILVPHCLQRSECPHKITIDVSNCKECGLCTIADLQSIARDFGVKLAVASGGTLARRFVEKYRPKAIVAVACERDLSSGILDANPIPVYGVLNMRPFGPCLNTSVDIEDVKQALQLFGIAPASSELNETPAISHN